MTDLEQCRADTSSAVIAQCLQIAQVVNASSRLDDPRAQLAILEAHYLLLRALAALMGNTDNQVPEWIGRVAVKTAAFLDSQNPSKV